MADLVGGEGQSAWREGAVLARRRATGESEAANRIAQGEIPDRPCAEMAMAMGAIMRA